MDLLHCHSTATVGTFIDTSPTTTFLLGFSSTTIFPKQFLSQTISEKCTSELLHSMAASKDILFWTPRGQLLRNIRIIPVTNIPDLAEYVLLPDNNDVTKPRALNTFLDGLEELGIDRGLIKNKKLLSDLIEKEKGYRNSENTSDNESNSNRSDHIEIINCHDR